MESFTYTICNALLLTPFLRTATIAHACPLPTPKYIKWHHGTKLKYIFYVGIEHSNWQSVAFNISYRWTETVSDISFFLDLAMLLEKRPIGTVANRPLPPISQRVTATPIIAASPETYET